MLEPSDSQEAYDFTLAAIEISERWKIPVLLRVTTRVCHTQAPVLPRAAVPPPQPHFEHDLRGRNLIPANARPAHRRLRQKLSEMTEWSETTPLNHVIPGDKKLGIITSGVCFMHAREAAPDASFLKLGFTHPLPLKKIAEFVRSVERCVVIEEDDPYLADAIRAAGLKMESKPEMFRFGELNVDRVRRILAHDTFAGAGASAGQAAGIVRRLRASRRFSGAAQSGLHRRRRHRLLRARRVAAVFGDGLLRVHGFEHSHRAGLAPRVAAGRGEARRERDRRQHVCSQRHDRAGRDDLQSAADRPRRRHSRQQHHGDDRASGTSGHRAARWITRATGKVVYEDLGKALGIEDVRVFPLGKDCAEFQQMLVEALASEKLVLIVARRPCVLAAKNIREYEKCATNARLAGTEVLAQ